jgi:hypothetical protein
MNRDAFITAVLTMVVAMGVLAWRETPQSGAGVWEQVLADLRFECDPASPGTDYTWAQSSLPTERRREQIIERCRNEGADLLRKVKARIALGEEDAEMHAMLIVIAAALGDAESCMLAARAMVYSDYPAVRISAAKTLRRLRDPRTVTWFRSALYDDHFVVNGACGTLREQFFPVRALAHLALLEMVGEAETVEQIVERKKGEVQKVVEEIQKQQEAKKR